MNISDSCKSCSGSGVVLVGLGDIEPCNKCSGAQPEYVIVAWAWYSEINGQEVNDGVSWGERKPEFKPTIEGEKHFYAPLYRGPKP